MLVLSRRHHENDSSRLVSDSGYLSSWAVLPDKEAFWVGRRLTRSTQLSWNTLQHWTMYRHNVDESRRQDAKHQYRRLQTRCARWPHTHPFPATARALLAPVLLAIAPCCTAVPAGDLIAASWCTNNAACTPPAACTRDTLAHGNAAAESL